MHSETVTIKKSEYEDLKRRANVDTALLLQLVSSIKEGNVRRVQ